MNSTDLVREALGLVQSENTAHPDPASQIAESHLEQALHYLSDRDEMRKRISDQDAANVAAREADAEAAAIAEKEAKRNAITIAAEVAATAAIQHAVDVAVAKALGLPAPPEPAEEVETCNESP